MHRILLALSLTGCATHRIDALELRVVELEARLAAVEARPTTPAPPGTPSAADEAAANTLYATAKEQAEALDYDAARATLAGLQAKYPDSRASKRAAKLLDELAIIGKVVAPLAVDRWLQGQASFEGAPPTLVVFVEAWCPHCQEEQPKLQELSVRWAGRLQVVAITQLTRTATEASTREWMAKDHVTYAYGVEDGSLSREFGVSGIPAAAIVKDGKVIWRGHPARLEDPVIDKILAL